ncbi:RAMP superfamily CRISPR-associated protein [Inediibacterium massiliense]|uniref:RAMP superfamily CRISPR-associated protein n=1 Tax=Inediibacterium massiliense TaxID=1658111 RepID=UPI0006B4DCB8|nr:RAMP superfamily CRISPR-associated protein [Inediibacterium massiliense]
MNKKLKIILKSEAIFNSGEAESNMVHMKALTDEFGFVYFHSKTLKGQLKDHAFWLYELYKYAEKKDKRIEKSKHWFKCIVKLFGITEAELKYRNLEEESKLYKYVEGSLKISNLELEKPVREYFINLFKEDKQSSYYRLTQNDLIQAQTQIRTSIRLKDGVAEQGGLVTYHTVKEGLVFYSELNLLENKSDVKNDLKKVEPSNEECWEVLEKIVKTFHRIGANTHRGRGEIEAVLEN